MRHSQLEDEELYRNEKLLKFQPSKRKLFTVFDCIVFSYRSMWHYKNDIDAVEECSLTDESLEDERFFKYYDTADEGQIIYERVIE